MIWFENIGNKIKRFAQVIFWIIMVMHSAGSIALLVVGIEARHAFLGVLGMLFGFALGFAIAWLCSFILFGYGQLIEDCEKNRKINELIWEKLSGNPLPDGIKSVENQQDSKKDIETKKNEQQPSAREKSVKKTLTDEEKVKGLQLCPKCGEKNEVHRVFCKSCGERLSK